eukprot:8653079-Pyramimonas_sp.AAC.1
MTTPPGTSSLKNDSASATLPSLAMSVRFAGSRAMATTKGGDARATLRQRRGQHHPERVPEERVGLLRRHGPGDAEL